jgi:hypothetical protein
MSKKHMGSSVDDFLKEEGIFEESQTQAIKEVVDREALALSAHPEFLALIERSREQFRAGRTLSLEEIKRAVLPRPKSNKRPHSKRQRGAK